MKKVHEKDGVETTLDGSTTIIRRGNIDKSITVELTREVLDFLHDKNDHANVAISVFISAAVQAAMDANLVETLIDALRLTLSHFENMKKH